MSEQCGTCRFFVQIDGLSYAPTQPMCRRFPEGLLKEPDDWCGEYQIKSTWDLNLKEMADGQPTL